MAQHKTPIFTQRAIEGLRRSADYQEWNRTFEQLRQAIRREVSPRDMRPLIKAGAKEELLLTLLAFVVYDGNGLSPKLMQKRQALRSAADQLVTVTNHVTRIVNDPMCDGRFWLALEGDLSWDLVPQAGCIESPVLKGMQALAQLLRDRGDGLGKHARSLAKLVRNRGTRSLIGYVRTFATERMTFDQEVAYLLTATEKAARKLTLVCSKPKTKDRQFTPAQIRKFRQRHFPATASNNFVQQPDQSTPKRKTFGQPLADSFTSLE